MTVADQLAVIARRHAAELRRTLVSLDLFDCWIGGADGTPLPLPTALPVKPRDVRGLLNLEREPLMARLLEILESDTDELGLVRSRLGLILAKLAPTDPTNPEPETE